MQINEYLKEKILIADGAMGTYYSSLVNQPGAVSELANLTQPELIRSIHLEYIRAGSRVIRTNTFAANCSILRCDRDQQKALVKAACTIAKQAVDEAGKQLEQPETVYILGNIGPIPENAQTGEEDILGEYKLLSDIFMEEALDGIHFETFPSPYYMESLVSYIKERKPSMFVMASFCINKNGFTGAGISGARIIERANGIPGLDAFGFNCGVGSGHMRELMRKLPFPVEKPIYISPNAGYPEQMQSRMVFMDNAEYFADNMEQIRDEGAGILGGCCGTTPEYIAALKQHLQNLNKKSIPYKGPSMKQEQQPIRENDFYRLLQSGKKVIAVELDPPFDANIDQIMECAHRMKRCGADVITFADSPMGRSRVDSILMGIKIAEETKLPVMPHLCCRDRNMISMRSVLLGAYIHGIRNLLLVTGDPVPGENRTSTTGVFDYNSLQLMEYVKEMNMEHFSSEPIYYGGALNHGRGQLDRIVERMKRKIEAGATYFLTQPIYCVEDVERIARIKEQVDTKILCGIMPLVSYRNACFIKNEMSQINVPDSTLARYRQDMSREEAEQVGAEIAREMMKLLEPVADGYYFMLPFNRVSLMDKILR